MSNIIIYSSDDCRYCQDAKEFFKKNNLEFVEYNISKDINAKKQLIKKRVASVPFIIINDVEMLGFDETKVSEILGI